MQHAIPGTLQPGVELSIFERPDRPFDKQSTLLGAFIKHYRQPVRKLMTQTIGVLACRSNNHARIATVRFSTVHNDERRNKAVIRSIDKTLVASSIDNDAEKKARPER